jgi:hypothetical protein
MKNIIVSTLITLSVFPASAYANENILINENGATLKLGDTTNSIYGLEYANTAETKRSALTSDSSTSATQLGSESEVGFAYGHQLNENMNAKLKLLYRNDVNNTLGATDGAAMIRFNYKFN